MVCNKKSNRRGLSRRKKYRYGIAHLTSQSSLFRQLKMLPNWLVSEFFRSEYRL